MYCYKKVSIQYKLGYKIILQPSYTEIELDIVIACNANSHLETRIRYQTLKKMLFNQTTALRVFFILYIFTFSSNFNVNLLYIHIHIRKVQ